MEIIISGKNIEVTDSLKAYVEEKIEKLDTLLASFEPALVHIELQTHAKGKGEPHSIVEATVSVPDYTIRAEETAADMYEAIDAVQERIERKLRDLKEKAIFDRRHMTESDTMIADMSTKDLKKIVKRKTFDLGRAITEDEAIDRLILLGHDFYVYMDAITGNQSVVYRRKDGGYGIMRGE